MKKNVVIIGGGPAGLMAGYQLKKAGIDFLLIDKNPLLGKKLLITGQGRCNVTNHLNTTQFINQITLSHRKFLYSSLSNFGTKEVVQFFESHNVPLYQDGDFKYFPKSNKAIDIRDVFYNEIKDNVLLNSNVTGIEKKHQFIIKTDKNTIYSNYVIVATGSKSTPKTGSTGDGLLFAKSFGIETAKFYPAETSVYSKLISTYKEQLQGIAIRNSIVQIKNTKIKQTGDLLFTHFGLSGPVIFHLSEFIYHQLKEGNNIVLCSLTSHKENQVRSLFEQADSKTYIIRILEQLTMKRVAKFILEYLNIDNIQVGMISQKTINKVIEMLLRFEVKVDYVEDLQRAYVNGGGVLVSELSPKSFETKTIDDLYFIGETVDVHGPIGGFNVTIAFSSGFAASNDIIQKEQWKN